MKASTNLVPGTFNGADLEPGTFHCGFCGDQQGRPELDLQAQLARRGRCAHGERIIPGGDDDGDNVSASIGNPVPDPQFDQDQQSSIELPVAA